MSKFIYILGFQPKFRTILLIPIVFAVAIAELISIYSIYPFIRAASGEELPKAVSDIFVFLQISKQNDIITVLGIFCFCAVLLSGVIRAFGNSFIIAFNHNFRNIITERILTSYLYNDYLSSLKKNRQEMESSLFTDTDMLISTVFVPFTSILNSSVVLLFTMSFLIYLDFEATFVALSFFGIVYFVVVKIAFKFLRRFSARRETSNLKRYEYINSILTLFKHIKINNNQSFYLDKAVKSTSSFSKSITNSQQLSMIPKFLIEALGFGVILLYLLSQMEAGGDLAKVAVFAFAGYRIMPLIQNLYAGLTQVKYGFPLLTKFSKFMSSFEIGIVERAQKEGLKSIELKDVCFSYDGDKEVVSDASLTIEQGDSIGFIGKTGSGKSTLIDIIAGLLTPSKGGVIHRFNDGTSIDYDNQRLKIAYVDQNVLLENKSIRENIVDHELANESKIKSITDALKITEDFAKGGPLDLDKEVLRNGENLSGGQKQRISILRALYKEPEVLILDEATSALDNMTQQKVIDGIHQLSSIKIILSIAHRIEALAHCNKTLEIKSGKVKEVKYVG